MPAPDVQEGSKSVFDICNSGQLTSLFSDYYLVTIAFWRLTVDFDVK